MIMITIYNYRYESKFFILELPRKIYIYIYFSIRYDLYVYTTIHIRVYKMEDYSKRLAFSQLSEL